MSLAKFLSSQSGSLQDFFEKVRVFEEDATDENALAVYHGSIAAIKKFIAASEEFLSESEGDKKILIPFTKEALLSQLRQCPVAELLKLHLEGVLSEGQLTEILQISRIELRELIDNTEGES